MTDDNSVFDVGKSRRSFLKEGALATGGLALGLSAGGAAAQEGETPTESETGQTGDSMGHLYVSAYYPNAKFAIVSDALDWSPDVSSIDDSAQAHMIRYLNTGQAVPLFVGEDADVGEFDDQAGYVAGDGAGGQMGTGTPTEGGNETEDGLFGDNETETETEAGNESDGGLFGGNETETETETGGNGSGNDSDGGIFG
jgi:hypothetical protein